MGHFLQARCVTTELPERTWFDVTRFLSVGNLFMVAFEVWTDKAFFDWKQFLYHFKTLHNTENDRISNAQINTWSNVLSGMRRLSRQPALFFFFHYVQSELPAGTEDGCKTCLGLSEIHNKLWMSAHVLPLSLSPHLQIDPACIFPLSSFSHRMSKFCYGYDDTPHYNYHLVLGRFHACAFFLDSGLFELWVQNKQWSVNSFQAHVLSSCFTLTVPQSSSGLDAYTSHVIAQTCHITSYCYFCDASERVHIVSVSSLWCECFQWEPGMPQNISTFAGIPKEPCSSPVE